MLLMERRVRTSKTVLRPTLWTRHGGAWICRNVTTLTGLLSPQEMLIVSSNCLGTWALYYFSDLTLSVFLPMATQLSMKAELPLAKSLATALFRSSNTGHRLHFIKSDLLDSWINDKPGKVPLCTIFARYNTFQCCEGTKLLSRMFQMLCNLASTSPLLGLRCLLSCTVILLFAPTSQYHGFGQDFAISEDGIYYLVLEWHQIFRQTLLVPQSSWGLF